MVPVPYKNLHIRKQNLITADKINYFTSQLKVIKNDKEWLITDGIKGISDQAINFTKHKQITSFSGPVIHSVLKSILKFGYDEMIVILNEF